MSQISDSQMFSSSKRRSFIIGSFITIFIAGIILVVVFRDQFFPETNVDGGKNSEGTQEIENPRKNQLQNAQFFLFITAVVISVIWFIFQLVQLYRRHSKRHSLDFLSEFDNSTNSRNVDGIYVLLFLISAYCGMVANKPNQTMRKRNMDGSTLIYLAIGLAVLDAVSNTISMVYESFSPSLSIRRELANIFYFFCFAVPTIIIAVDGEATSWINILLIIFSAVLLLVVLFTTFRFFIAGGTNRAEETRRKLKEIKQFPEAAICSTKTPVIDILAQASEKIDVTNIQEAEVVNLSSEVPRRK